MSYSDAKGADGKKAVLITAAEAELAKLKALKTWLGFSLFRRDGDTVMRVRGVLPSSPAVFAGLADDMALYKARDVPINSIADFAGQIKGSQVGDKIILEVDKSGSHEFVTLIVGTQAAPMPFVNTIVRIAVDKEILESDYELPELKPAVDEWVAKNASELAAAEEQRKKEAAKEEEDKKAAEEAQKKAEEEAQKKAAEEAQKKEAEEKAKAAAVTSPTASKPAVTSPPAGGKRGCKFGFRQHTDRWKKDICLMCGQTKAAHEEGYVPPEPKPAPAVDTKKKEEEEEKARKEKEEQEAQARAKEEQEKREREEEEKRKKELEEQEAKLKEEAERLAREEQALKDAEAKFAQEEEERKKKEEEEKAAAAAAAASTPAAATTSPKPQPSRGKKCPFGFKPDSNPRKKGYCAICGRTEADHAGDGQGATSPPSTTTSISSATSPPAGGGGVAKAWSPFLQKQFEEKQKKEEALRAFREAEEAKKKAVEEAERIKREEEERIKREEEERIRKEEEERLKKEEEERLKREEEERLKREEEERLKREEEERLKREEEERIKREEEEKNRAAEEAKKRVAEEEEKRKAAWASASPAKAGVPVGTRTRPKCPFGFKPDSNPRKKGICAVCGLTEAEHVKK